jgi:hypothetical protein
MSDCREGIGRLKDPAKGPQHQRQRRDEPREIAGRWMERLMGPGEGDSGECDDADQSQDGSGTGDGCDHRERHGEDAGSEELRFARGGPQ